MLKKNKSIIKLSLDLDDVDKRISDKIKYLVYKNLTGLRKVFEAVLKDPDMDASAPWNTQKLMIVGQKHSGKTSLMRSLLGKSFVKHDENQPTLGANVLRVRSNGPRWELERESEDGIIDYTTDMAIRLTAAKLSDSANLPITKKPAEGERQRKMSVEGDRKRKMSVELREKLNRSSVVLTSELPSESSSPETSVDQGSRTSIANRNQGVRASVVPVRSSVINRNGNGRITVVSSSSVINQNGSGRITVVSRNTRGGEGPTSGRTSVLPARSSKGKSRNTTINREPQSEGLSAAEAEIDIIDVVDSVVDEFVNEESKNESIKIDPEKYLSRPFDERILVHARNDLDYRKYLIWDFAGHEVFHSMHQLLMTSGIYLLTFSLVEFQTNPIECCSQLRFWLDSINFHAGQYKLFLVGTFADKVVNKQFTMKMINRELKSLLGIVSDEIVKNPVNLHVFFSVDNISHDGVKLLRETISREAKKNPQVRKMVPLRWVACLDSLKLDRDLLRLARYRDWYTVGAIAKHLQIVENELEHMISFFHDAGVILRFPAIDTIVVTDPQWLINSFCALIRSRHLSDIVGHGDMKNYVVDAESILEEEERLFENGIASDTLLQALWQYDHQPIILAIMKKTFLIAEWHYGSLSTNGVTNTLSRRNNPDQEFYIVPSMLKASAPQVPYGPRCLFNFTDEFLPGFPDGSFERLISLCISETSPADGSDFALTPALVHSNWARFQLSQEAIGDRLDKVEGSLLDPAFYLVFNKNKGKILLVVEDSYKHIAKLCFDLVTEFLSEISKQTMHNDLEWVNSFERINNYISLTAAEYLKHPPWFDQQEQRTHDDDDGHNDNESTEKDLEEIDHKTEKEDENEEEDEKIKELLSNSLLVDQALDGFNLMEILEVDLSRKSQINLTKYDD